ncbi:MAG: hypothetical protein QOE90_2705 [Thermoplasmata archaeon]|jgi:hypothetical protein|nr:hypothetical protein [Thermoplasmata archaeon]
MKSTMLVLGLLATGLLLVGAASATPPGFPPDPNDFCFQNGGCGIPTPQCVSDNSCFQCWTEQGDPTSLHCTWH